MARPKKKTVLKDREQVLQDRADVQAEIAALEATQSPENDTPTVTSAVKGRSVDEEEAKAPAPSASLSGDTPLFAPGALDAPAAKPRATRELATYTLQELLALRGEIDALLPATSIRDLDLEEEVLIAFQNAKALQQRVSQDVGVPANQRAQVANSLASILKTLVEAQKELYDTELVKIIESCIERAFAGEPEAIKKAFFERYARMVRDSARSRKGKKT